METSDLVVEVLRPVQSRYNEIMADKGYLEEVLATGAQDAYTRARKTVSKVYRKIGFVAPKR